MTSLYFSWYCFAMHRCQREMSNMESNNEKSFFADYMDYSVEKKGRIISNPFEILTFDLLCFFPSTTVLTLTSTLIGDSAKRFVEYDDFWKEGLLKIHFSRGDTADKYLSRKLSSSNSKFNNYEIELYKADGTDYFVNGYLRGLLYNNIDYVFPRTSNADINNRKAFLDNLAKFERRIIENPYHPMPMRSFDSLAYELEKLADDISFTFQRSKIIHALIKRKIFNNASSISDELLAIFDLSYSQAMAKSINATSISSMRQQLNGEGLKNFIMGFSQELYREIISMEPRQVFLLAKDREWQIFRNYICQLFELLSSKGFSNQSNLLHKIVNKTRRKRETIEECIGIMADVVFDSVKQMNPVLYFEIQRAKDSAIALFEYQREKYMKQDEYISEQIVKRINFTGILRHLYIKWW